MKQRALGIAVGALLAAALVWLLLRPGGEKGVALSTREEAMKALGARIAETRPGVGVLVNPHNDVRVVGEALKAVGFEDIGAAGLVHGQLFRNGLAE